jgi:hypothetical protein
MSLGAIAAAGTVTGTTGLSASADIDSDALGALLNDARSGSPLIQGNALRQLDTAGGRDTTDAFVADEAGGRIQLASNGSLDGLLSRLPSAAQICHAALPAVGGGAGAVIGGAGGLVVGGGKGAAEGFVCGPAAEVCSTVNGAWQAAAGAATFGTAGALGGAALGERAANAVCPSDAPSAQPMERRTSPTGNPALSSSSPAARAAVAPTTGMQNWQAHHLIPLNVIHSSPALTAAFQKASATGWKTDSVENLVALPADNASYVSPPNNRTFPMHNGSHPQYDAEVRTQLSNLEANYNHMTPTQIRSEIARVEFHMQSELVTNRAAFHPRLR